MIGVFDSGAGGLTVLSALRTVYPSVDVVYFGDTKNAPYGSRTQAELNALTAAGLRFLTGAGATALISACNSVSASLALSLYDVLDLRSIPVIEMVGPCVAHFKERDESLALCATEATVRSGLYQNAFRMIGKEIQTVAIPDLAGAIERGASIDECEAQICAALAPLQAYDTLILGCTHYPLVINAFSRVTDKTLYDPATAVAERALRDLWPREMGYGKTRFCISKESSVFRDFVARLFPEAEYTIEVV